ncbi:glyoxylase-like metal-dependent hydrolase (beta-lactamase superfamily II) [Peribacillus deserti]|uniref:Glyoxylase-like metal-dependent hydrolase (Beta-lactamase superfamily II) n=1 Tax=Peribacillus deserti TaxID=673318 RepID=A0ABS2QMY4_9BACI|nr:MBL fold metallo-hydrolase [Peribacillus deserti]MBM7693833.1 glyoxylase-like metal-dependent hydrolase (beta-lactamase superfamily II) [Peribacillus deserti]
MVIKNTNHFEIERLENGIFAAIAKQGGGAVSNSGIIDLGDKTIIFDTFNSQNAARELADIAEKLTKKPVSCVINSHWHGDHIRGNQCFQGAVIISSLATRTKMIETHPERISDQKAKIPQLLANIEKLEREIKTQQDLAKAKKLRIQLDFLKEIEASLPKLEFTPRVLTFENRMVFSGENRTAILQTYGGGHTLCDAFLYLPKEKVLFSGDLVTVNNHPLLIDGHPDHWIDILQKLKTLETRTLIPGHGPVSSASAVEETEQYIKTLITLTDGQTEDFRSLEIPVRYQDWEAKDLFYKNIEFLSNLNQSSFLSEPRS